MLPSGLTSHSLDHDLSHRGLCRNGEAQSETHGAPSRIRSSCPRARPSKHSDQGIIDGFGHRVVHPGPKPKGKNSPLLPCRRLDSVSNLAENAPLPSPRLPFPNPKGYLAPGGLSPAEPVKRHPFVLGGSPVPDLASRYPSHRHGRPDRPGHAGLFVLQPMIPPGAAASPEIINGWIDGADIRVFVAPRPNNAFDRRLEVPSTSAAIALR